MAIIDFVKWDGANNELAWKFPSEELSTWTQLIVNESQEAYLLRGGVFEGPFGPGRHTLSTENIPLVRKLFGLPFGGKSPFTAEIWYINKVANLNLFWGTPDPIQVIDPKYKILLPVRSHGQYAISIDNSKKFLKKLVGTVKTFNSDTLTEYFRGDLITRIKNEIANVIIKNEVSPLEIANNLSLISSQVFGALKGDFEVYGVKLEQFNINSINVPEDNQAVINVRNALSKKAEMGIIGFNYQQERSFDVMETAAANEGSASEVLGAGLGLAMGAGMGSAMSSSMSQIAKNIQPNINQNNSVYTAEERIKILKELSELRKSGAITDEEFQIEKSKIIGQ
jgi:membrane protease subunit (stomatin/prohibitin family)